MKAKVLIVDDHWMVREGIRNMLLSLPEVQSVEEAPNGQAAIFMAERQKPDVIIMDYQMSHTNGLLATRKILEGQPMVKILFCSVFQDKEHLFEAVQVGARGFICKDAPDGEFIDAFRAVLAGGTWFRGKIAERIASRMVETSSGSSKIKNQHNLSVRELEVIQFVSRGLSSKVIGEWLGISPRTVDVHKSRIYRKLGISNASELMLWAIRNNIVQEEE